MPASGLSAPIGAPLCGSSAVIRPLTAGEVGVTVGSPVGWGLAIMGVGSVITSCPLVVPAGAFSLHCLEYTEHCMVLSMASAGFGPVGPRRNREHAGSGGAQWSNTRRDGGG